MQAESRTHIYQTLVRRSTSFTTQLYVEHGRKPLGGYSVAQTQLEKLTALFRIPIWWKECLHAPTPAVSISDLAAFLHTKS